MYILVYVRKHTYIYMCIFVEVKIRRPEEARFYRVRSCMYKEPSQGPPAARHCHALRAAGVQV